MTFTSRKRVSCKHSQKFSFFLFGVSVVTSELSRAVETESLTCPTNRPEGVREGLIQRTKMVIRWVAKVPNLPTVVKCFNEHLFCSFPYSYSHKWGLKASRGPDSCKQGLFSTTPNSFLGPFVLTSPSWTTVLKVGQGKQKTRLPTGQLHRNFSCPVPDSAFGCTKWRDPTATSFYFLGKTAAHKRRRSAFSSVRRQSRRQLATRNRLCVCNWFLFVSSNLFVNVSFKVHHHMNDSENSVHSLVPKLRMSTFIKSLFSKQQRQYLRVCHKCKALENNVSYVWVKLHTN